ncbi:MAG: type II secretion system F family protein, partial [Aquificaceae bacterium]|nr:type II secretion system F family protein [Aquificaceae bacterium]
MPRFRYRALDENGSIVEQEATFPTEETLVAELQQKGMSLIEVVRLERGEEQKEERRPFSLSIQIGGKVSDRDMSIFCRQLGTMINAGLSLIDGLNILGDQLPNKKLADASKKVAKMVSEGMPISQAMSKFPSVFPEFVINLVRVGEETGNLDIALTRAADYYEKMAMIKS